MTPMAPNISTPIDAASPGTPNPKHPPLLIHLRGSQREMGTQHGQILREVGGFEKCFSFYPALAERLILLGLPASPFKRAYPLALRPLFEWGLRRLEKARPLCYRERSHAFSHALGRNPKEGRHQFVTDLFQNVVGLSERLGIIRAGIGASPACSTLIVWGRSSSDGKLRHARNFDLPGEGIWDQAPTVVFCTPESGLRYGFVATRGADVPGITAFNEAGIALSFHTRFHRNVRFDGLGAVDLGHEIIRRAETLNDAIRIAGERPIASTWGIAISSGHEQQAILVETTGNHIRVTEPANGESHLASANRYRHPDLQVGEVTLSPVWPVHSKSRETRMNQVVARGRENGGLGIQDLQCLLGDHIDPEAPNHPRAAGSVIANPASVKSVVVEPESRSLWFSIGTAPTGWGPFVKIEWNWNEEVGFKQIESSAQRWSHRQQPVAGYRHFLRACTLQIKGADAGECLSELECAVTLAPRDPAYRFLAGALCVQTESFERAFRHFEMALSVENGTFRRGQILLWASRAASALGDAEGAQKHRDELLGIKGENLEAYRAAARREAHAPLPPRRLRKTFSNLMVVDAHC